MYKFLESSWWGGGGVGNTNNHYHSSLSLVELSRIEFGVDQKYEIDPVPLKESSMMKVSI